jgi:hypothetical protein
MESINKQTINKFKFTFLTSKYTKIYNIYLTSKRHDVLKIAGGTQSTCPDSYMTTLDL